MYENLKKWIKLKTAGTGERTFTEPAKTASYKPINHRFFARPRDLDPFTFATIHNMLLDQEVRMALATRCAPLFGAQFAYKKDAPGNPEGHEWVPGVEAARPEVGKFVQRQLERVWRNHLHEICLAQVWGWAGGEVTLKLGSSKLVEFNRLESRHADDIRPAIRNGKPYGVRVKRVEKVGHVDLKFPNAFFHNHFPAAGEMFGESCLLGAYSPWADKWFHGGALDVRRLFMKKDAYGGADLGYPEGSTPIDGKLEPVPNRDIARQIVEQMMTGAVVTRPSERDENGNEKWPFERASVASNPQHILQYPKDLDSEIRTGIGVVDGIMDSDNNTGLGNEKSVAMDAFFSTLDVWIVQIINDLVEQVLEPLVLLNWGKAIDFQVCHKPLGEQAMDRQKGGQQQPGGMPGMPGQGQPGQEGGGGDPLQGLFGGAGGGEDDQQPMQPQMMSLVGQGLVTTSELVQAANNVIRMSLEKKKDDDDQQARLIAEILTHVYGDDAESKFDEIFGDEAQRMSSWNPLDHPRGPDGRFIERNSPQAIKAAKDQVRKALSGRRTPASLKKIVENLAILTVGQLNDVKKEFGVKAGGVKQSLVDKISERIHGAIVNSDDEQLSDDERVLNRGDGTPSEPENQHVYTVPTSSIGVDASRFQYKVTGIGEKGVTKELKGTKKWNPELGGVLLVWRDPENDEDYVINGHHRHELASRVGASEINVRYIDAPTAVEARARGALANIAEGRGSAIDAAKYLRDSGADVEHLKRAGVSLSGRVAADAAVLVDLSDRAFQSVAEGRIEESQAVAVAKHLKDDDLQDKLFRKLEDKDWTRNEIETAAKKMANARKFVTQGTDLFGDFEDEESTFDQEVEIESFISRMLSREANDFRSVANTKRAERVADAGNILATDENSKRQRAAELMTSMFSREAQLKGAISATIGDFAVDLAQANGKKEKTKIKEDALNKIKRELSGAVRMSLILEDHGAMRMGQMVLWEEEAHPRDADGKFAPKNESGQKTIDFDAPPAPAKTRKPSWTPFSGSARHRAVYSLRAINGGKRPSEADINAEIERLKKIDVDLMEFAAMLDDDEPIAPVDDAKPAKPKSRKSKPEIDISKNFHYEDSQFFSKGKKTKFRDNIEAIRTMRTMAIEGREEATPEEQATISKYVGWGQFVELFGFSPSWDKERKELRSVIGNEKFASAKRATTNSHFTHPDVVKAHWDMAQRLGFNGGRYLDPGAGSGFYLGMMPQDLAKKTATTAIEMDEVTGEIAKKLYPAANVKITPFQNHPTPDNFYDLVATNVPFSGAVKVYDPKYKGPKPVLHDYYFMRSVDTAKPGGLVMHLTSAGTMDKLSSRVRDYINEHCELVSAIRFPGDTHKANAGTSVVTDMLILRKKHPAIPETTDETPDDANPDKPGFTGVTRDSLGRLYYWRDGVRVPGPQWSDVVDVPNPDPDGEPIRINKYFADNPEQMLGTLDSTGSMYGGDEMNVTKTDDYEQLLNDAVMRLPEGVSWADKDVPQKSEPERIETDAKYNEGQLVIKDGEIFQHDGGALAPVKANGKDQARIIGMVGIKDHARELIKAQQRDEGVEEARAALNQSYDEFVAEHGPLHDKMNRRAMRQDPDAAFLRSLENFDSQTKEASKADLFSKNTIRFDKKAEKAGSLIEATGIGLHESGRIDVHRIAELTGRDVEDIENDLVESHLAFEDPDAGWKPAAEYLSGNTRQKLLIAKAAAELDERYQANVEALERHQPEDIDHEDIGVKLGAPWIPPDIIAKFSAEVLGARESDFDVAYVEATSEWNFEMSNSVRWRGSNTQVWAVKDDNGNIKVDFQDVLRAALAGKALKVKSAYSDENGNYAVLPEATEAAREKVDELKERFKDWVWSDEDRRENLHRYYNDNYNNIVPMRYDGSHLTFPGMRDGWTPRQIQKDFVWRVITTGKGLAAHEVGTGKTFSMVASAMELRRLGLAKKPALACLKSNIEQITAEAQEMYPGAKILSTADMFSTDKRQETLNRIATGDFDMIVLTHDHLDAMKMKPETTAKFMQEEIEELEESILAAALADGKMNNRIVKRLENQKMKLEEQLKEALNESSKDDIFFEDTGIDQIFVDEAHKFKALPCYSRRGEIKGIPARRSQRATNMLARTRWLLDNNDGRGVVFATGTPIANTMGELFNMQRYLQFDSLKERGLHRFDAWADTYGDTVSRMEFKLNGDVAPTTRFAEFVNLPELRHLASEMMDVQRADNMKKADGSPAIIRPDRTDQIVLSPENDSVKAMMVDIHARAEALKGKRTGVKGEDNMLSVCNDAKLGSIDMRLIDQDAEDHPDSKANQAVRKIVEMYHKEPGTTQAVFSDSGVHPNKWGFSVFQDMKRKLIAAGIPASEIANFSDQKMKGVKREEAQQKMRKGNVRIAFGSTGRLGTGTNVQKKLRAIHHLDIPYVPAYLEQRDGRGYRSGNSNKELDIYKYVQEGSADNLFWQIVANKSHFINQYMLGSGNRTMQDLDTETLTPDEMMAVATGDKSMLERVALEDEVKKLRRTASRHKSDTERMRHVIKTADDRTAKLTAVRDARKLDAQHFADNADFEMTITHGTNGRYLVRKDAAPEFSKAVESAQTRLSNDTSWNKPDSIRIGTYKSMPVHVMEDGLLQIEGPSGEVYQSGASLRSLEYATNSISKKLSEAESDIVNFGVDLDKMRDAVSQPFRHREALEQKEKRLRELKVKK